MRRGWGLSEQGLTFIVVMVAAFVWIAAIIHAIRKGLREINRDHSNDKPLWPDKGWDDP